MKYWYLYTYWCCPICGNEEVNKERQYTDKPQKPTDRHKIIEQYDYCDESII